MSRSRLAKSSSVTSSRLAAAVSGCSCKRVVARTPRSHTSSRDRALAFNLQVLAWPEAGVRLRLCRLLVEPAVIDDDSLGHYTGGRAREYGQHSVSWAGACGAASSSDLRPVLLFAISTPEYTTRERLPREMQAREVVKEAKVKYCVHREGTPNQRHGA